MPCDVRCNPTRDERAKLGRAGRADEEGTVYLLGCDARQLCMRGSERNLTTQYRLGLPKEVKRRVVSPDSPTMSPATASQEDQERSTDAILEEAHRS